MSERREDPLEWLDRRTEELALANARGIVRVIARWLRETFMPFRVMRRLLAQQIAQANALAAEAATAAADLWAAEEAEVEAEELWPVVEERDLAADEAWLAGAIETIFEADREQIERRMEQFAYSEPIRSSRERLRQRLAERGVTEYVRVVAQDACDACADRVGEVRAIDVPWSDHPNCRCSLQPKVSEGWGDQVRERSFQLREVHRSGARISAGITFGSPKEGESK